MLAAADPNVSYHTARLVSVAATAVLAIAAGSFLVPMTNAMTVKRLDSRPNLTPKELAKLELAKKRQANPVAGMFLGKDGRLSTSTTMAWCWTVIIVWILLALIIAWPSDWSAALKGLDTTYYLLLGGPYAAFVLSRAVVATKVANKTLQKPAGDGVAKLSDLVSDDQGNPDLFDVQYVMFNVTAMAFVIAAFIHTSESGFPSIPGGLLFLTGGPAAVFVGNKALSGNGPAIFSVTPGIVAAGDQITIYGQNFLAGAGSVGAAPPGGGSDDVEVLVGGFACAAPKAHDDVIRTTAPTVGYADLGPLDISVITPTGVPARLRAQLVVRNPPILQGLGATTIAAGDTLTVSGQWYDPALVALALIIDGTVAVSPGQSPIATTQTATFVIPPLGVTAPGKNVTVSLRQNGSLSAGPCPLFVTP
jgi:IPT/TIG domain